MNLGEEYRWNIPVITYAFDPTFIDYFGLTGISEVESAIKIMNDLPPTSSMTDAYINSLPLNTTQQNPTAAQLSLFDLKSVVLQNLVRYQGLASAVRFTWTMRSRVIVANGAVTNWTVIMRNFDPITFQPTNVVNGNAYTYSILDNDNTSPQRDAREVGAIPTSLSDFPASLGDYYFGLTRDDVGGIRYIYRTNNFNVETILPNISLPTFGAAGTNFQSINSTNTSAPWNPVIVFTNVSTNIFIGGTNLLSTNTLVTTAIRGGINKVTFKRVNFDALLGQTFQPLTNFYTDKFAVSSNGVPRFLSQRLERTVGFPDLIFSAGDNGVNASGIPITYFLTRTDNWINNSALNRQGGGTGINPGPGLVTINAGPGLITPGYFVVFNNVGPWYWQSSGPGGAGRTGPDPFNFGFVWGSFDGVTIKKIYPEYLNLTTADLELLYLQSQGTSP